MTRDELVEQYIKAWNAKDSAAVLELMHAGAAYYDAFWRENCVGRDLRQYFEDTFAEEPYRYEKVGAAFGDDDTVIFRYNAFNEIEAANATASYCGVEMLTVRDGKILTITDIYCNPDQAVLEELATLESRRHGVAKYANDGLGALRSLRLARNRVEHESKKVSSGDI